MTSTRALILTPAFAMLTACATDGATQPPSSELTGDWSGEADSVAGQFIREGTFPVRASFAEASGTIVGFIDLEQGSAQFAEHLGFRAKGTVTTAGVVALELTDRLCGAGDPMGLCYPSGTTGEATFVARGRLVNGTLTLDSIEKLRMTHDTGIAVEAPFERLSLTFEGTSQIVGPHIGYGRVPRSEVYPLPLPLIGTGTMTIASDGPALSSLVWEGTTYVPVPDDDGPIVLADSWRFDPATGQYWFLQVSSVFSRYVYIGKQYGDELRGAIWSEDVENPTIYRADAPPVLFTDPELPNLIGTFNFPAPDA